VVFYSFTSRTWAVETLHHLAPVLASLWDPQNLNGHENTVQSKTGWNLSSGIDSSVMLDFLYTSPGNSLYTALGPSYHKTFNSTTPGHSLMCLLNLCPSSPKDSQIHSYTFILMKSRTLSYIVDSKSIPVRYLLNSGVQIQGWDAQPCKYSSIFRSRFEIM
jgi:hypothetical protein